MILIVENYRCSSRVIINRAWVHYRPSLLNLNRKSAQKGPSNRFLSAHTSIYLYKKKNPTPYNHLIYLFPLPLVWVQLFSEVKWLLCSPVSSPTFGLQFTQCGASHTGRFPCVHSYSQYTLLELLHRAHLQKQHQAVSLRAEAALGRGLYGTGVERRQAAQHRHILQSVGCPGEAEDSHCQGLLLWREGHSEMEAGFW